MKQPISVAIDDIPTRTQDPVRPTGLLARMQGFVQMTRPSVVALVFFTAVPMMALNDGRWPALTTAMLLIFGIALCAGASSVFNAYIERETDARMTRTRNRPLPTGLIRPRSALLFAWLLTIAGLAILWFAGHWLGALVGALTIAFYVFVYTIWLKPKTPLNIVIGGAAGAAPPLIVDASLNGSIGWLSVALFGLVFLWTPPHFWAIALFRKQDYAMAGFPMLPLTHGDDATRRQILGYSLLMIPFALLPAAGSQLGMVYGVIAATASVWFCLVCWRLLKTATNRCARQTMLASLVYLHVVFTAMTICLIA